MSFVTSGIPDISATPHYIHVLSGDYLGENITIVSATSSAVVLEHAVPGDISGDLVAIRPHTTIASTFVSSVAPDESTLAIYREDGTMSSNTNYPGLGWYGADFLPSENTAIPPGHGYAFNTSTSFDLLFFGEVPNTEVAVFVNNISVTLMGSLNPVKAVSIEDLNLVAALPTDAALTFYETVNGRLQTEMILFNYVEYGGFWDSESIQRNDYPVDPIDAVVINTPAASIVPIPSAYQPE